MRNILSGVFKQVLGVRAFGLYRTTGGGVVIIGLAAHYTAYAPGGIWLINAHALGLNGITL